MKFIHNKYYLKFILKDIPNNENETTIDLDFDIKNLEHAELNLRIPELSASEYIESIDFGFHVQKYI